MADAEAKPQTQEKPQIQEKQTNCLSCNKPIKKRKKYYRNGKYYCSKKCYKKTLKKEVKDEAK